MTGTSRLNSLPPSEAHAEFHRCCGSAQWAQKMVEARPFSSESALLQAADSAWTQTSVQDRIEAFSHHPRIGEQRLEQPRFAATSDWSRMEQVGMEGAAQVIQSRFTDLNRQYLHKFGFVFLLCATGKSAAEMLAALESRLAHSRTQELRIAAEEQAKITRLRLQRLLNEAAAAGANTGVLP